MRLPLTLALLLPALPAHAETALIAVATNFAGAAEQLAADYGAASGDTVTITAGATGKLYAQITAGAPFDAFLSADTTTPTKLESEGAGVAGTAFPYATGTLVLWSPDAATDLSDPKAALTAANHVAIANPDLAPYGAAAVQTIEKLGLTDALKDRIVTGENIGQAQTLVASGAADLGFVAASGLTGLADPGASWVVPADLHDPLTQGAILLSHGAQNPAAKGFLAHLASPEGQAAIAAFGYAPGQ